MSRHDGLLIDYGELIEREVGAVVATIAEHRTVAEAFPARWLALELLENGADLRARLQHMDGGPAVIDAADAGARRLDAAMGDMACIAVADRRYRFIHDLVESSFSTPDGDRISGSDRMDRFLTHRLFGLPVFLLAMWITFKLTADVSAVFVDWIDAVVGGPISRWVTAIAGTLGLDGTWAEQLLTDGVLAGVGGVLAFVPVLMSLYFALAILEDSGYMARAAVVMDRTMRTIGLPGKSFLPMLVGFGCTVPAIYATRTLERRKDRILTGLLVPFMSCGARLPVYVLFAAVFFPDHRGLVVFSMYLLGIVVALALGLVANRALFSRRTTEPLIIELPSYRRPSARTVWQQMSQRTWEFVKGAGTVILVTSVVVWLLMAIPIGGGTFGDADIDDSAFATVSSAVAPVLEPAGFGSWEATGALASGFVAKEVVVSSLAQVYGTEEELAGAPSTTFGEDLVEIGRGFVAASIDTIKAVPGVFGVDLVDETQAPTGLMAAIRSGFEESSGGHGGLAGVAFLVFVLLYTPCVAAIAAERHELGSRWMWTSVIGQTVLAWTAAVAVFQVGKLVGLG